MRDHAAGCGETATAPPRTTSWWSAVCACLLGLACGLSGCVHSDVSRALRAHDQEAVESLLLSARTELAEGRAKAAAQLYEAAIERSPDLPAELYLAQALAKAAAHELSGARASARFALLQPARDAQTPGKIRELLVLLYASDGLYESALDYLDPPELVAAAKVAPLAQALGLLLEADRLARANQPADALLSYAEWLSAYGVPDHPLLRRWSDVILQAAWPLSQALLSEAERAVGSGELTLGLQRYAQAFRYQPSEEFARSTEQRFVLACARLPELTALDPEALAQARAGDAALHSHRLGDALRAYRQAVVTAPWWPLAHRNLALLLASAGHFDSAARELGWFQRLNRDVAAGLQAQRLAEQWRQRARDPQADDKRTTNFARGPLLARREQAARGRRGGYALLGISLSFGVGAAVLGYLGDRQNAAILAGGFPAAGAIQSAADQGQMFNLLAFGALGAAGAALLAGVPIVATHPDPRYKLLNVGASFNGSARSGETP